MVSIGDKDVKWDTKEEVVKKIMNTENHLMITVVTPIQDSQKPSSEYDSLLLVGSSSTNAMSMFPPSSSRTSFSSLSSSASDRSSSSGSEESRVIRKGSTWSVLKIKDKK